MNIRYSLCTLIVIGMTACSEVDDIGKNSSLSGQELAREEIASDMPIIFAPVDLSGVQWQMGDVEVTRGVSLDDSPFTMDGLGLFCLAKKKMQDGPMNPVWNGANKTYKLYHVWEDNELVSIKSIGENKGVIQWNKSFQLHYYPSEAWYSYGFVAYHPWTNCLSRTLKGITAYFKVDGNDDVIHALCQSPKHVFGDVSVDELSFSKQYYDEIRTRGWSFEDTYPLLEFHRLMSRLDFYFCLDDAPFKNIHVDKVEFDRFPSVMEVPLASVNNSTGVMASNESAPLYVQNQPTLNKVKINGDTELLVNAYPEMATCFDHFELREKGETSISGITEKDGTYRYNLTAEMKKVGDCILIPPVKFGHSRCNIELYVTLCDDSGKKFKNSDFISIPCPTSGWVRGTRYDVRITLNAPPGYSTTFAPSMRAVSKSSVTADDPTPWETKAIVTVTPHD